MHYRVLNRASGLDMVVRGSSPGDARDSVARAAGYADYETAEAIEPGYVDLVVTDAGEPCECGCGEYTTRSIMLLREQDAGTAEALGWDEMSIRPMRVPVRVAPGHEDEGIDGYVTEEP